MTDTPTEAIRCDSCGRNPTVEPDTYRGWNVVCDDCYDGGDESNTEGPIARGDSREQAVECWNEEINSRATHECDCCRDTGVLLMNSDITFGFAEWVEVQRCDGCEFAPVTDEDAARLVTPEFCTVRLNGPGITLELVTINEAERFERKRHQRKT